VSPLNQRPLCIWSESGKSNGVIGEGRGEKGREGGGRTAGEGEDDEGGGGGLGEGVAIVRLGKHGEQEGRQQHSLK
jgi:hypothetical protein